MIDTGKYIRWNALFLLNEVPNIYTTIQKFGVTQAISCFPWKLTLLFIKWVAKWIENIVKTLTRLEIRIFIWNNNFVLQTLLSSNNSPFAAITVTLELRNQMQTRRLQNCSCLIQKVSQARVRDTQCRYANQKPKSKNKPIIRNQESELQRYK